MKFSLLVISLLFFHTVFSQSSQSNIRQDSLYEFKAKLTDNSFLTPDCGIIAFAVAKKFEIIESKNHDLTNKYVTIIIQCPELYGNNFFVNRKIYSIKAGLNNDASFGWAIVPSDYAKKKLPVFWASEINLLKK